MIGVKGRFVPCVIRIPLFQNSADGHPALPVPSPSTPGLPAGQAGYCPSAYSFRANSKKSDSNSGDGTCALHSGGICSSFVPQDQIAACLVGQRKVSPVSSCSFEPFVTFVVKTGDSSCRLVLSRGIRSSFVPRTEYRMTAECCIVRRTKILFLSGKNT